MKKLFLLFIVLCAVTVAQAQVVSAYTMQATQGTYTEITDGTVMDLTSLDPSVEDQLTGKAWYPDGIVSEETTAAGFPIGFDFTFNDVACNQFIIGAHGYIALGKDVITNDPSHKQYIVIREDGADNIIGVMPNVNAGIYVNPTTEISYKLIGEAPNRTLVVQFKDWGPCFGWDAESVVGMNMQLRLNETSNTIDFVFGDFNYEGDATKGTRFTLRGYYDDVLSLTEGEEEGMLNCVAVADDNQLYIGKDVIINGLTYTFTPPAACVEPTGQIIIEDLVSTTNSFFIEWENANDADHILLLLCDTYLLTQEPVDGVYYNENDSLGNAIVLAYSTDTTYESDPWELNIEPSTEYYIHIYSANSYCSNGPVYGKINSLLTSFSTKPAIPESIEITETTLNTLTFNVEANGTDEVFVVLTDSITPNPPYAHIIDFGNPEGEYAVGDIIDGKGRVVYIGPSAQNIVVEGLKPGTAYYLRAHSYNPELGYSSEVVETADVTIATLPWTVDLSKTNKQDVPVGWTSVGSSQKLVASGQQSGYGVESMHFYVQIKSDATNGHFVELTSPYIIIDKEDVILSLEYNMHVWQRFGGNKKYDEWNENDTLAIQVSRNGGQFETLTLLNSTNNVQVDTVTQFLPITANLAGYFNDTIQVRLYWKCFDGQQVRLTLENWLIDTRPLSEIPEIKVKDITHTSAKVMLRAKLTNNEIAYAKTGEEFITKVVEDASELVLTDLEAETEYQVKARGIIAENEYSDWSEVVTFTTTEWPECDAPTNLEATVEGTTATLTWEGTEEHLTWDVRYRDANSTSWTNVTELEETTYVLENLEEGVTYLWNVRALCTAGRETAWSAQGSFTVTEVAPAVPVAPVVTAYASNDTVHLTWEAVEGATYYRLYYGENKLSEFEETAVDIQVIEAGTYCFTVTAVNEIGESEHSNEACAEIVVNEDLEIPAAPTLEARIENESAILSWNSVEGATYYDVYYGDQRLGSTQQTEAKIGLPEPGEYCFTVRAGNIAGVSGSSNVACVTYGESVEELNASFNIYPNPVNDRLYIETEVEIEKVEIYTITGVLVYNEQCTMNNLQLDVTNLNSGVYFVKVVTDNGEIVKRFVKK